MAELTERYPVDGHADPTGILREGDGVFAAYHRGLQQWRYYRIGKTDFDRASLIQAIERAARR